jgi:hypothetical protein
MGISIRAYARQRGVSHVAVLRAIKHGRVELEADGILDPQKADASWERTTEPGLDAASAHARLWHFATCGRKSAVGRFRGIADIERNWLRLHRS